MAAGGPPVPRPARLAPRSGSGPRYGTTRRAPQPPAPAPDPARPPHRLLLPPAYSGAVQCKQVCSESESQENKKCLIISQQMLHILMLSRLIVRWCCPCALSRFIDAAMFEVIVPLLCCLVVTASPAPGINGFLLKQ